MNCEYCGSYRMMQTTSCSQCGAPASVRYEMRGHVETSPGAQNELIGSETIVPWPTGAATQMIAQNIRMGIDSETIGPWESAYNAFVRAVGQA